MSNRARIVGLSDRIRGGVSHSWRAGVGILWTLVLMIALPPALASGAEKSRSGSTGSGGVEITPMDKPGGDEPAGDAVNPGDMPQNRQEWRYVQTPINYRLGVALGDQAAGPIRYNTRFPEIKGNPHPASYYHAAAFAGVELEVTLKKGGGLLLGGLTRRDVWHRGIVSRAAHRDDGQTWVVDEFSYQDQAMVLGWVLGERYREAPWVADFSLVYDRGVIDVRMTEAQGSLQETARARVSAVSFRARAWFSLLNTGAFQVSGGPEIHLPVWSKVDDQVSDPSRQWIVDSLDFKASAAVGASLMSSVRF